MDNFDTILTEEVDWIEKFIQIGKEEFKIKNIINNRDILIYRIFEKSNYDSELEFYRSRSLNIESLVEDIHLYKINFFRNYEDEQFLNEMDRDIVTSLANLTVDQYKSIKFIDEYGAIILKRVVETNRCFFSSSTKPLKLIHQPKKLTFSWLKESKGNRLVSNLNKNEFLIADTTPPMCIDIAKDTIYEVDSIYKNELLKFMLNSTLLSNSALNLATKIVMREFPEIEFPMPKDFEIEEIKSMPIPYLLIYSIDKSMSVMELTFLYDNYEIEHYQEDKVVTQFEDNRVVSIIRNIEFESININILERFGFMLDDSLFFSLEHIDKSSQEYIEKWRVFIEDGVPKLRDIGWYIEIDDSFRYEFEYIESITIDSDKVEDWQDWFNLSFKVNIGGEDVPLMPIIASLLEEFDSFDELPDNINLEIEDNRFLHIAKDDIKPVLNTLFELFDKREGDNLLVNSYDAHLLDFNSEESIIWRGGEELRELSTKLRDFKEIERAELSPNLNAKLREYQQMGVDWLNFLYHFRFGGILADDMGLGKTIQSLAFLQMLKYRGELTKPALIIMPTSLIGNWKSEIDKFTPDLKLLEMYGSDRAERFKDIPNHDLILTTYQLAQRDESRYREKEFLYIILDEAQKIKNPKTKMAIAIKSFKSKCRLALSGTPIENHLGELWSIFDFLMSGFLGNLKEFKSLYQNPIEKENNKDRRELLNKKVAPFILRRTKDAVVKELPPKTEIVKKAKFDNAQARLYENIRITMEKRVRDAIEDKGLARSHITILDALLKLRQVCCHPKLLKLDSAKGVNESAKLEMFLELIDDLTLNGKKILVFSQFTSMLSIIEDEIKKRDIKYTKLIGSTRDREKVISEFTKGDATIFLISLKAGGVGLNLVEADTVIHYDPWWNPAVENQATDRAYRIGQDKPVFVYKLIVENSIEENILELQEKKKSIQASIYDSKKSKDSKLNGKELLSLLKG